MADINVTAEDVRQAEALEKAISAAQLKGIDICAAWKVVKPFWPWIINVVKWIPKVGDIIAKALEFLGKALDAYCANK
jgi:hypothetical protein